MMELKQYFLVVALSFLASSIFSQTAVQKATIENPAFDRTVSTMIKHSVPLIGVDELAKTLDKYVLLDAREEGEYKVSHLEGAIYIGYDQWDKNVVNNIDKDSPIVIYCSIGVRSEKIGEKLAKMGYTNVRNLYGSIFEWANKGYPLVDNAGYPTMKIHGYNWAWGRWMSNEEYQKVYK